MPRIDEKLLERMNAGREYRNITQSLELRSAEDGKLYAEGYATTFNEIYVLWSDDSYTVQERIDPHAFDECDMSDVIFQLNHTGRVYARTRNKTLQLKIDSHGLWTRPELSGTAAGRDLWEEIKGGYLDRMSFGFVVAEDRREIVEDREKGRTIVTRTITKISKLYDVSVVSIPANDGTEISARGYCEGVIAEVREQERLAAEELKNAEALRVEIRQLLGNAEN